MASWTDSVIADVNNKLPPDVAADILKPQFKATDNYDRLLVATPDYPKWLSTIDEHRKVDLLESVRDFQRRRVSYTETVLTLLNYITFFDTGMALMNELVATQKKLFVRPYRVYRGTNTNADAAAIGTDGKVDNAAQIAATRAGMPIYDSDGNLVPGSGGGQALNAVVEFSPLIFGFESEATGPGTERDEVLFHEMVHASRIMRGQAYAMPVNQGYDTEEEYISIVLTNVYMSEKRQVAFRASHEMHNRALLQPDKFLDNVQGVDLPPMRLIERFRLSTPDFYAAYAAIGPQSAKFNPIRDFEARRKGKTLSLSWQFK